MTRRAGASRRAMRLESGRVAILTATSNPSSTKIDEPVVHGDVHGHVRVAYEKVSQRRREVEEAETHRGADPQPTARRGLQMAHSAIGVGEISENPFGAFEVAASGIGQA